MFDVKHVETEQEVFAVETRVCGRQESTNATLGTVDVLQQWYADTSARSFVVLFSPLFCFSAAFLGLLKIFMFGVSVIKH